MDGVGASICGAGSGMGFLPALSRQPYATREDALIAAADHVLSHALHFGDRKLAGWASGLQRPQLELFAG